MKKFYQNRKASWFGTGRFPPPWTMYDSGKSFHVKDANGQIR
jgi:hypothetical protein